MFLTAARVDIAAKHKDQAEAWLAKATTDQPPRLRLAGLVRSAQLWEAAGQKDRAIAAWRQVIAGQDVRELTVDDRNGLPQEAGIIARQRIAQLDADTDPKQRRDATPSFKFESARPTTALPLGETCAVMLAPGESFLPLQTTDGPVAERIWSAQGKAILSRSRQTGEVLWKKPLPFAPEWLAGLGTVVVACGKEGTAGLSVGEGERLWTFLAPPLGRYPADSGDDVRVVREVMAPEPLCEFHLANNRLFMVQGGRRLLALDARKGCVIWQRWAPGAAFAMPAPRGRYPGICPVGETTLLVQASGRRWFLDAATGKIRHEAPATLEAWSRKPLLLKEKVCLTSDAKTVEMLDGSTAKVEWTYTLPGKTTRSGEPPLVVGAKDALFVVEPENIGYRLQRLTGLTGKPMWQRPPLLALESLEPAAWLAGPKRSIAPTRTCSPPGR